ncbi:LD-carboxypeptidase [Candidatus Sumerlaeota bacterium]|nr:LD-carboxypeptidase [Candidatus Sumerlaeota bacterium]
MKIVKPQRLKKGDTIGVVVPASPPSEEQVFDKSQQVLEGLGYRVIFGSHCRRRWGFLAGSDDERLADLEEMFANPEVQAVFCLRGGWGTARLLRALDFDIIRHNPKVFVGFSDITMLHLATNKFTGLVTFHGPMLASHLIKDDLPEYTSESLWAMISEPAPFGSILPKNAEKPRSIVPGQVEAPLIGGNLSIIVSTLGTPYEIETEGKILFIEDVDEKPYRVDRMLTHLLNAGKLQEVAGVVCGGFTGCEPDKKPSGEWTQSVDDVLEERLKPLGVPVAVGFPFGHIDATATLPVGIPARLVAGEDSADLIILSPAVL